MCESGQIRRCCCVCRFHNVFTVLLSVDTDVIKNHEKEVCGMCVCGTLCNLSSNNENKMKIGKTNGISMNKCI